MIPEYISSSKIVLFTYKIKSILSSGLLMDSLNFDSYILASNIGAFKDLANRQLIHTYNNLNDGCNKISKILKSNVCLVSKEKRVEFCRKHSWHTTVDYLATRIDKL